MWPTDADALIERQQQLAGVTPVPWALPLTDPAIGGCWVCFPRGSTGPGATAEPAWTAAVTTRNQHVVEELVLSGAAGAPYVAGLLALRVGPLIEEAVGGLRETPDVLLVDGTGRDHPRGAGLAVHLGAELDVPTVGVTHRPLLAEGAWPKDDRGATTPLRIGGEVVAAWVRTRAGVRPLAVHPGWRVDLETAVGVVLRSSIHRTPQPLRLARHAARAARAASQDGQSTGRR
jgi:deoxyribonuclease V